MLFFYLLVAYSCFRHPLQAPSKIVVVGGSPGEQVCKEAKKEKATLVVVGSRGMSTIRRTILGSVSDYIIHHAHIPVIMCPKEEKHH